MHELAHRIAPKLLFVVVDKDRGKQVSEFITDIHDVSRYRCRAQGTASSEMLDLLGLGRVDKSVTICMGPGKLIDTLLTSVSVGLRLKKKGRGIAFTVPISGVSTPFLKMMDEDMHARLTSFVESEVDTMKCEANYELVMAVINRGYSEELMNAAREAGATGGTVVPARRLGGMEAMKAWGISVQEEKEIVYIVVKKEDKVAIMQAIGKSCGFSSPAQGFVVSLPVDHIEGIVEAEPQA